MSFVHECNKNNTLITSKVCYDKLNFLYNNIDNSLSSEIDEIEIFISTTDTDLSMLSEIKLKRRVELLLDTINIKNYTLFTNDISCLDTRGVGIYIKNCLKPVGSSTYQRHLFMQILCGYNYIQESLSFC